MWCGKRLVENVCGLIARQIERLKKATSQDFTQRMARASQPEKCRALNSQRMMLESIHEELIAKFAHLNGYPYKLFGMLIHYFDPKSTEADSKAIAKAAIDWFDSLGSLTGVHRVTIKFLSRKNDLRNEIEIYLMAPYPLHCYSGLWRELLSYAVAQCTERHLEGCHGEIHRAGNVMATGTATPAYVCATYRFKPGSGNLGLLGNPDFITFAVAHWHATRGQFQHKALVEHCTRKLERNAALFSNIKAIVYCYHLDIQYRKTSGEVTSANRALSRMSGASGAGPVIGSDSTEMQAAASACWRTII